MNLTAKMLNIFSRASLGFCSTVSLCVSTLHTFSMSMIHRSRRRMEYLKDLRAESCPSDNLINEAIACSHRLIKRSQLLIISWMFVTQPESKMLNAFPSSINYKYKNQKSFPLILKHLLNLFIFLFVLSSSKKQNK